MLMKGLAFILLVVHVGLPIAVVAVVVCFLGLVNEVWPANTAMHHSPCDGIYQMERSCSLISFLLDAGLLQLCELLPIFFGGGREQPPQQLFSQLRAKENLR